MSIERLVEQIIDEAMQKGEFDDLPNKGKKLDLDGYFSVPEERRLEYSVLKNAGVLPVEAQTMGDLEALRKKLENCDNETEREQLKKEIQDKTLKLNITRDMKNR
jgi:hypothetical protein